MDFAEIYATLSDDAKTRLEVMKAYHSLWAFGKLAELLREES